jgi:hypothetical protein
MPTQHLPRVHARLEDLQRDQSPDRVLLLSQIDDPAPAFTNLFPQPVAIDPLPAPLSNGHH